MNPLLELKERLTSIAVAGTQLLAEDFRLKKTEQMFAALAEKNPVFKKGIRLPLTGRPYAF